LKPADQPAHVKAMQTLLKFFRHANGPLPAAHSGLVRSIFRNGFRLLLFAAVVTVQGTQASQNRIRYNGQDLFLCGANLAWVRFANDIGPGQPDLLTFAEAFSDVHGHGGNAMRLWLHTTGENTPEFSGSDVVGPGKDAITDLKAILDLAWEHEVGLVLCLWSFDMMKNSLAASFTNRSRDLLTLPSVMRSYIDNALVPMVSALKGHPGIAAWEVFNEPEGMSVELGWSNTRHVPMASIQRFINWCAGAIHRADPKALVTNGSWAFKSLTDAGGNRNYYSDQELTAAGGDTLGTLDFYQVHYYDWAGEALSPFHHPASAWDLDKPILVGEFSADTDLIGIPKDQSAAALYENGYAGALAWAYRDPEKRTDLLACMQNLRERHPESVTIVHPAGTIKFFKAEPGVLSQGDSSTLSWNTAVGSSVWLDGHPVGCAGRKTVAPEKTTSYTLVAAGAAADTCLTTVRVLQSGVILSFSGKPAEIGAGETGVLSWSTVKGSEVFLNGEPVDPSGSRTVKPERDASYTLTTRGEAAASETVVLYVADPMEINRALDRPVTASSEETGSLGASAGCAVDGDFKTRWTSVWMDNQRFVVDLGERTDIRRVVLYWETAYGKSYSILVSDDTRQWTELARTENGDGGVDDWNGLSGKGRYVCLEARRRGTSWGFSLWEFQVFGAPARP